MQGQQASQQSDEVNLAMAIFPIPNARQVGHTSSRPSHPSHLPPNHTNIAHSQHQNTNTARNAPIDRKPDLNSFPTHSDQNAGSSSNVNENENRDIFESFLSDMPSQNEDPTRFFLFIEMIKLKVKGLELQIAEARQKEREAQLELARLRASSGSGQVNLGGGVGEVGGMNLDFNPFAGTSDLAGTTSTDTLDPFASLSSNTLQADGSTIMPNQTYDQNNDINYPSSQFTSFDVEAMMHDHTGFDNLFSWLPDFNYGRPQPAQTQTTMDPSLFLSDMPIPSTTQTIPQELTMASPMIKKRSASPTSDASSPQPTKRPKKIPLKKVVIERTSDCTQCSRSIAKVMFRSLNSQIFDNVSIELKCTDCSPVEQPSSLPDTPNTGTSIGTVEMRKRMRSSVEVEDEKVVSRRTFCDVCKRIVASGRIVNEKDEESMTHMAEIICSSCDSKYQRCTDCGGGGGPRIGIGKWRMKQAFQPGRKTCSISHTRLGDRLREIGVHVTPTDFNDQQLKEVLIRTKGLWNEKTMARLVVPVMLEIDLPPDVPNPITDYAEVEDVITRNWPTREAMIRADGIDPTRFKRLLGLTWAHAKPRRTVRSVDIEEEYGKTADGDDEADDMSTVLANIRRTNIVIPPGSDLVGMWGGEWDMQQGALLITTLIPFEGQDGEDSTALSVGEMITKVQALRLAINEERETTARQTGRTPDLIPQCEHLWVVSGGTMPLVRERMADLLIRKRSFVHVEEFLTRHPDFQKALDARPSGLHPDLHRPIKSQSGGEDETVGYRPLILVRWLGKDFDAQRILEIKQQEFGGKARLKKKGKGRV